MIIMAILSKSIKWEILNALRQMGYMLLTTGRV